MSAIIRAPVCYPAQAFRSTFKPAVWRTLLCAFTTAVLVQPAQASTIEAINHTHWAINRFSVDGRPGLDIIGAYQGGGGGCCYIAPQRWKPGMTERVYCQGSQKWKDDYRDMITLGMAPGGIVKVWVGGACLGFTEVGRFQAEIEPLGPYKGKSNGQYVPIESENKAYIDKHGIPYDTW